MEKKPQYIENHLDKALEWVITSTMEKSDIDINTPSTPGSSKREQREWAIMRKLGKTHPEMKRFVMRIASDPERWKHLLDPR
jgi:hypothetical protein